ncbi:MAG TPA: NAD(P)/FAD-dependent oxidoreductase [Hyphomicrobiaceae bacterium]|nr:NAD(P)/FAD-dependent oxidoreductase [Hyphomicrobiaceae bacterium]
MSPRSRGPTGAPHPGLDALAAEARRDFARLRHPAPNWVPCVAGPDGKPALDVLVIGGGMCGQTLGLALARDGIANARIVDRATRGQEGPWATYARMDTLRSPKHLTGPDLGFPSLTFRAWYEAQHGAAGWERLSKIATRDWLAYLLWVRDTAGVAVENGVEAVDIDPGLELVRVALRSAQGEQTLYARKVVLAGGRDGSGAPYVPAFPSLATQRAEGQRAEGQRAEAQNHVFHSSDTIDFARFKGGSVGVLGASASAFDNAAVALEAGAREVRLFSRRSHLPQINKSKWAAFPGFFHGFCDLDDDLKWRIYTYMFALQTPPPNESVLRCDRHAGFTLHFAEPWRDVEPGAGRVAVTTDKARYAFDAVILATGFSVELASRPELARVHKKVLLWRDRILPTEAAQHPQAAHFPYLGRGFEFIEHPAGAAPGLGNIHCFNWGVTLSHGAMAGDIPGLAEGVNRLARALAAGLFVAGAANVLPALARHDDRELEPTRYFVQR